MVGSRAVKALCPLRSINDLEAVDLDLFVVRPDLAVELQRVREPRAPPTLHAHPQEDVFGQVLSPLELFDLLGRSVGQLDRHKALPSIRRSPPRSYVVDAAGAPAFSHFSLQSASAALIASSASTEQ